MNQFFPYELTIWEESMQKKLQVFVSSTFTDLKMERQAAVSAILNMGHIPAGMELFTANDTSQWETIRKWIDESDVYMLILGARYGSVDEKSGISYTELEYEYALKSKKPLFAVVVEERCIEQIAKDRGLDFIERIHTQELKKFRDNVLKNMCSFYEDTKDIQICVMKSLPKIDAERELTGWISGRDVSNTKALVDELSTLSKENKELQKKLSDSIKNSTNSTQDDNFLELSQIFKKIKYNIPDIENYQETTQHDLFELFQKFGSKLITGIGERFCTNEHSSYIFTNVFPKFELYDLVYSDSQANKGYFDEPSITFTLTELGRQFTIFNEKQQLLGE